MRKAVKIASVALASLLAAGILQAAAVTRRLLLPRQLQLTGKLL